jgi:hypothetical protein
MIKKLILPILLVTMVLWQEALYVTNDKVRMAWDVVPMADYYEVKAVWVGSSGVKQEYPIGITEDVEADVSRPRTGHFFMKVRACNEEGCGEYSESTDPTVSTVDGEPMGWRVFFELPPPPSGGID